MKGHRIQPGMQRHTSACATAWYRHRLLPDWPAPPQVQAWMTTRIGGESSAPYDSFNLGLHSGDTPEAVARNRAALTTALPGIPHWLRQVHGTAVHCVGASRDLRNEDAENPSPTAVPDPDAASTPCIGDAWIACLPRAVCAVLTADCLPVFFAADSGTAVGLAHAGWRGLHAGVLETTVARLQQEADTPPERLLVWLGAAIGPTAYVVGSEVYDAFCTTDPLASRAFVPCSPSAQGEVRYRCDLYALARLRLVRAGVRRIWGGGLCTASDPTRFFSYRRDGAHSGRMASIIWFQ